MLCVNQVHLSNCNDNFFYEVLTKFFFQKFAFYDYDYFWRLFFALHSESKLSMAELGYYLKLVPQNINKRLFNKLDIFGLI